MMHRLFLAAFCASASIAAAPALASDAQFFKSVAGVWTGPGEIVAGKYKGTKFNCKLTGGPAAASPEGMTLEGACRVGMFSQKMKATVAKGGKSYRGQFLDGAAGEGLDIVSGRVEPDRVIMGITRKDLDGAMVARMMDERTMNVTISVEVGESMVPVIGMTLDRDVDAMAVGSVN